MKGILIRSKYMATEGFRIKKRSTFEAISEPISFFLSRFFHRSTAGWLIATQSVSRRRNV